MKSILFYIKVLLFVDICTSTPLDNHFIKVCRGTNYKIESINISPLDAGAYSDLKLQFENCTHVVGNLELINIPDNKTDLSFLQHIRQVTGYINIQNVRVPKIVLPKLEVIHGKDLIKDDYLGYALEYALRVSDQVQLVLPELKAILNGGVKIFYSLSGYQPCYFDTINWDGIIKILANPKIENQYLRPSCQSSHKCDPSCVAGCWGEGPDNCEHVQYFTCSLDCNEQGCFGPDSDQCCHTNCVGGCTGPSEAECAACRHVLLDGSCEDNCSSANGTSKIYSAQEICVKSCPTGLYRDDDLMECVFECSNDKEVIDNVCVPCTPPKCKICTASTKYSNEFISGIEAESLENCTILLGNLEFKDTPHQYAGWIWNKKYEDATIYITIPPKYMPNQASLYETNLRLLNSLRKITGSVRIDDIKNDAFRSLHFLSNLEEIGEGLSIKRTNMRALNLRSLRKVYGGIAIFQNSNLCYATGINWRKVRGDRAEITIQNNAHPTLCERRGEVCSDSCQVSDGCWGLGSENCLSCKRYLPNSTCEEIDCKKIIINPDDPDYDLCNTSTTQTTSSPTSTSSLPPPTTQKPTPSLPMTTSSFSKPSTTMPTPTSVPDLPISAHVTEITGAVFATASCLITTIIICYLFKRKSNSPTQSPKETDALIGSGDEELEIPLAFSPVTRPHLNKINKIDPVELIRGEELSRGHFGVVYEGTWTPEGGSPHPVAIKMLKFPTIKEFLHEASIMFIVDHPNLLGFWGVCEVPSLQLVTPLLPLGSLSKYVVEQRSNIEAKVMLDWCTQMASGMAYLESLSIIHRDLALRNVLVETPTVVKITDFGLARFLDSDDPKYEAKHLNAPCNWLAIESILDDVYTHKSDVWQFGVTVWELLMFGEKPFRRNERNVIMGNFLKKEEIRDFLLVGNRLEQPPICKDELYAKLMETWRFEPMARPTFKGLIKDFGKMANNPDNFVDIECQRRNANMLDFETIELERSAVLGIENY